MFHLLHSFTTHVLLHPLLSPGRTATPWARASASPLTAPAWRHMLLQEVSYMTDRILRSVQTGSQFAKPPLQTRSTQHSSPLPLLSGNDFPLRMPVGARLTSLRDNRHPSDPVRHPEFTEMFGPHGLERSCPPLVILLQCLHSTLPFSQPCVHPVCGLLQTPVTTQLPPNIRLCLVSASLNRGQASHRC